jgi:DNA-binding GntR family transcriptional regulator
LAVAKKSNTRSAIQPTAEVPAVISSPARGTGEPHRAQMIYDELRSLLRSGSIPPGAKLKLRELATQYGTSLTPVRDALTRLVAEQALQMTRNSTAIVPVPSASEIREVKRIRMELEGLAAEEAAKLATKEQILHLETLQVHFEDALKKRDRSRIAKCNMDFHYGLYEISKLPVLLSTIDNFWLRTGPLHNVLYSRTDTEGRPSVMFHRQIIAALRKHDSVKARQALASDIADSTEEIISFIINSSTSAK